MTTFTLNRNLDAADCLFVALNDSIYADWRESQGVDSCYVEKYAARKTFGQRIMEFFGR